MEETPWTGLVVHLQALKAAWSCVLQGVRKTDYWMKSQTLSNRQAQSPAAFISALEDHYLFTPWWWATQTFIYRIRKPTIVVLTFCVSGFDSSLSDIILVTKQFVTICDMIHCVCISFPKPLGSKFVEQIDLRNANKDCHSQLLCQLWQSGKKHTFSLSLLRHFAEA